MSGRSGYRKTNRRQSPPRPLIERLHDLNKHYAKLMKLRPDQGQALFRAPERIERLIHLGSHCELGFQVDVFPDAIVARAQPEDLLESSARFLETYTRGIKNFDGTKMNCNIVVSLLIGGELSGSGLAVVNGQVLVGI